MGFISCAKKYLVSTFHTKNPALQDSILVFNQDCELVSQLPTLFIISSQLQIHFITSETLFLSTFRKMSVNSLLTNSDLRNEVYRICKKINSFVKRKKYR